jgi:hypothetical protein
MSNKQITVEKWEVDSQPSPSSTSMSNCSCQYGQVLGFAVLNLNREGFKVLVTPDLNKHSLLGTGAQTKLWRTTSLFFS